MLRFGSSTAFLLFAVSTLQADDPCRSGIQPGQRPGPYAFLVATGTQRGKSHCFVCETEDRPAIIVFARTTSDPLGKLLSEFDQALLKHKAADLRGWATFLSDDQPKLDPQLVEWARKHSLRTLPVGVFEDKNGPPAYRLNPEADVTILLSVKQKVVANFAFRAGELNEERVKRVVAALPQILPAK